MYGNDWGWALQTLTILGLFFVLMMLFCVVMFTMRHKMMRWMMRSRFGGFAGNKNQTSSIPEEPYAEGDR